MSILQGTMMSERIRKAVGLAMEAHEGQYRKGTDRPYITHPLAVMRVVEAFGGAEDVVCAAVLHDAVEDGGGLPMLERIRAEFGERVASIVEACTDSMGPKGAPKGPWKERKEAFIARLKTAPADVALVVAADKVHNLEEICMDAEKEGVAVFDRFKAGRGGTEWFYGSCAKALEDRAPAALVQKLKVAVKAMQGVR